MLVKEPKLDPRVKRTRQLLLESLMELLQEKNLQAITVQNITERATLNRATFYAHFEDKYVLFDYLIQESFIDALQQRLPADSDFNLANLYVLILAVSDYLGMLNGHCSSVDKRFRPTIELNVQSQIFDLIYNWIEPEYMGSIPLNTLVSVVSWSIFGAVMNWSKGEILLNPERHAREVTELLEGIFRAAHVAVD